VIIIIVFKKKEMENKQASKISLNTYKQKICKWNKQNFSNFFDPLG